MSKPTDERERAGSPSEAGNGNHDDESGQASKYLRFGAMIATSTA